MMKTTSLLFLIAFFCFLTPLSGQSNQDSLLRIWNDESQTVVTRLEAISAMHLDKENLPILSANPDTVFHHAQLQYDLAEANGLKYWMSDALSKQGGVFLRKNDHTKASEYYREGLALAEEIGDKKLIAKNSFNLGTIPLKEGDFALAFPYFQRATRLFEELDEKNLQAMALASMAFLCAQQQDLERSNEYLEEAISIREEIAKTDDGFRNKWILAGMKQTLKTNEARLVLLDESIDSIGKAEAAEEINIAKDSLFLLAAESDKAFPQASTRESTENTHQVAEDEKGQHYFGTVASLTAEAQIHLDQKDTINAIPYLEEALSLAQKEGEISAVGWTSYALYQSYRAIRQYRKSLNMLNLAVITRDSINQ